MKPTASTPPDPLAHVRERRARLLDRIAGLQLDGVLLTDPAEIIYFTASPLSTPKQVPACLLVRASGESMLCCGESPAQHLVDQIVTYSWHDGGSISTELTPRLLESAHPHLRLQGLRIGVQYEAIGAQLLERLKLREAAPIDRLVFDLERTKDALDLFRIRRAIHANLAAFASSAKAITPGASELEVFAAAARSAMLAAGEKIVHDGDYRSNAAGGPCSDRTINAGDLYIVDAWTQTSGYWSDLARTFAIGTPTEEQSSLIGHVRSIHPRIRPLLRPGVSGGELWSAMDAALREHPSIAGLSHHGGHGVGLRLHEAPDINPGVADRLRPGDVVCIEPGAYLPFANVRIEETYLITSDGAECLSSDQGD